MTDLLVSWPTQVVAHLCQSKRDGLWFDDAWALALTDCPPRSRDAAGDGRLFNERGRREETLVDATERFCRQAWTGEKPGLARLSVELLADLDLMGLWAEDAEPVAA